MELYERLKHAEMLNLERRSDIAQLRKHFGVLLNAVNNNASKTIFWSDSQALLADIQSGVDLQLPSIHHFLPHLLSSPNSLTPSVKVSRGRSGGMNYYIAESAFVEITISFYNIFKVFFILFY